MPAGHADTIEAAIPHYNETLRHRYRLAEADEYLAEYLSMPSPDTMWSEVEAGRRQGDHEWPLEDPACAVIARYVAEGTPEYIVGNLQPDGTIPQAAAWAPEAFDQAWVIVFNPSATQEVDWEELARRYRDSTQRERTLRRAEMTAARPGPAEPGLDPSRDGPPYVRHQPRTLEAAYVFKVSPETVATWWKGDEMSPLRSRRRGRPRNR